MERDHGHPIKKFLQDLGQVPKPDSKLVSLPDDRADMEISFKPLQVKLVRNPGKSSVLDSVVGMDFLLSDSGMFQEVVTVEFCDTFQFYVFLKAMFGLEDATYRHLLS